MIALLVTSTMLSMLGGHVLDVPKSDQLGVNGIRFALPKVLAVACLEVSRYGLTCGQSITEPHLRFSSVNRSTCE
jgi:hypothetical protein